MPRKNFFEIGSDIFAKWPGTNMYYPGTVVEEYDKPTDSYMVKFESELDPLAILAKNISKPSQVRQWRSRSASPARTPGRKRRTRSRSKSPSRASSKRSPTRRRSPGRKPKSTQDRNESSPNKEEVKSEQDNTPVKQTKERVETKEENSKEKQTNVIKEERSETIVTRRVTRSVARIQEKETEIAKQEEAKVEEKQKEACDWLCQLIGLLSTILMPLAVLALGFVCSDKLQAFSFTKWPKLPSACSLLDWRVLLGVGVWFDFQFVLTKFPFGEVFKGSVTKEGQQLTYRCNGFIVLFMQLALLGIGVYTKTTFHVADLADKFYLSIIASAIIVAFGTSVLVALKTSIDSNFKGQRLTPANFFNGRETNPSVFTFDIKWCCSKASFMTWIVLDLLFVAKHYSATKGEVNCAAVAVAFFQLVYLAGTFYLLEKQMATSPLFMEMAPGFGFILGTMVFVPLFYSMQVLYLVKTTPQLPPATWALVIALQVFGYYIFFKANAEKSQFRSDPKKAMKRDVKVVFTQDGKNLLADGWWGRLRHPNYLGDILVAISWAIPGGCNHAAPWLYPIALVVLLVFMAKEDDQRCAKKYGLSWDEYKDRVKYVIFPYVY